MYWSRPVTTGDQPPAVRAHSFTAVGTKLYLFGGGDGNKIYNDLYICDTGPPPPFRPPIFLLLILLLLAFHVAESMTWKHVATQGDTPSPRRAHTAVCANGKVYVFGGGDGKKPLGDTYALTLGDEPSWAKVTTSGTGPPPRAYHTTNIVGQNMIVFGGSDGSKCFGDIFILNLGTRVSCRYSEMGGLID